MGVKTYNEIVARNIRFLREERGLSQEDLGILARVRKQVISKIENQEFKKPVDPEYLMRIANALRVPVDALDETNEEIKNKLKMISDASKTLPVSEESVADAEELLKITSHRGIKERISALLYLGDLAYVKGKNLSAFEYYEVALSIAERTNEISFLYKAKNNVASALMNLGGYNRAEMLIKSNLDVKSITSGERARCLFILGSLYYNQGSYELAEKAFKETIIIVPPTEQFLTFESKCYQAIGAIYNKLGMFGEAVENAGIALQKALLCNDKLAAVFAYKTLAEVYESNGDVVAALHQMKEAQRLTDTINRPFEGNLIRFLQAKLENNYAEMKRLALEMSGLKEAPPHEMIPIYEGMAEAAYMMGDIEGVVTYFRKANQILKSK